MAETVYGLCALTSLVCAILLARTYRQTKVRLLLWSSLCFFGLAANNILLFVDLVILPDVDLSIIRTAPALAGMLLLVYGLIWDLE
jgi:energy-converting hydrogenase Eha subunit G